MNPETIANLTALVVVLILFGLVGAVFFLACRKMVPPDNRSFTIACDRSPFYADHNRREQLFRVKGLRHARSTAEKWVATYPCGQARVLAGHHYWEDEHEPTDRCHS